MKHIAYTMLAFGLTSLTAQGQDRRVVYTHPQSIPDVRLQRLNLARMWSTYVPTAGARDGLASVQVFDDLILVKTRSCLLAALDPENGHIRWTTRIGAPYHSALDPGVNAKSVFVYSGNRLFALDRATGKALWDADLPNFPSSAPAADNERIYVTTVGKRLVVYAPPPKEADPTHLSERTRQRLEIIEASVPRTALWAKDHGGEAAQKLGPLAYVGAGKKLFREPLPEPRLLWEYRVTARLDKTPLLFGSNLALGDSDGVFYILTKEAHELRFSVATGSAIMAPIAPYGNTAYVASRNFNVFAFDIEAGAILWRFLADRPIIRKPIATDEDVYVAPERGGLFRIDRKSGKEIWRNMEAERYIASNKSFVYTLDPYGTMLILDRARGSVLGSLNVRDYAVPVPNEVTDRIYLAANDGLITGLRDRDYPKPLRIKNVASETPAKAPAEGAAPEKPAADKADKKPAEAPAQGKAPAKPAVDKGDKKPSAPTPKPGDEKMEKKEK